VSFGASTSMHVLTGPHHLGCLLLVDEQGGSLQRRSSWGDQFHCFWLVVANCPVLEYLLSLTRTLYTVQRKIL